MPYKPVKQDYDLKFYPMKITEDHKEEINNSLKEIQENTNKQEVLTEEMHYPLKNYRKTQSNR